VPAPTDSPLFATQGTYTADGDPWQGDPVRVDPGVGRRAEGYEPTTLAASILNHQLGVLGDWAAWLEAERARMDGVDIALDGRLDTIEGYVRADLAASRCVYLHALGFAQSSWDGVNSAPAWRPSNDDEARMVAGYATSGRLTWGLAAGAPLPSACTITAVRAFVEPAAARTGTNRMRLRVYRQNASGLGAVQVGSDTYDDGTTGLQTISITGLSIALNNDRPASYALTNLAAMVRLDSGVGTAGDRAYLLAVEYEATIR
jgi:hypothetical protein